MSELIEKEWGEHRKKRKEIKFRMVLLGVWVIEMCLHRCDRLCKGGEVRHMAIGDDRRAGP